MHSILHNHNNRRNLYNLLINHNVGILNIFHNLYNLYIQYIHDNHVTTLNHNNQNNHGNHHNLYNLSCCQILCNRKIYNCVKYLYIHHNLCNINIIYIHYNYHSIDILMINSYSYTLINFMNLYSFYIMQHVYSFNNL